MTALAIAISERPGFFDTAFDIAEYDTETRLRDRRPEVRFGRSRHYVPAWGVSIETPDGTGSCTPVTRARTRPMVEFARDADLLLVEAALRSADDDDPVRGHLTVDEAIDLATPRRASGPR